MIPDQDAMRFLGGAAGIWRSNFYLPTSSTRYVLSYYVTLTGTWAGFHHIQFMGFYSTWGKSIDIKGPTVIPNQ